MKAHQIINKARLYLNDMNKTRYSDWELFSGVNDALRMLAEENASTKGSLFRSSASLSLSGGSVLLPEDFVREVKCFGSEGTELFNVHNDVPLSGEFSVSGEYLFSGDDSVVLWYFCYPERVSSMEDDIKAPDSMLLPISKITAECVKNANESGISMARYFLGNKDDSQ